MTGLKVFFNLFSVRFWVIKANKKEAPLRSLG